MNRPRRLRLRLALAAVAGSAAAEPAAEPIGTAAELAAFLGGGTPGFRAFAVTGRVSFAAADAFVLSDGGARVHVAWDGAAPSRGALVRAVPWLFIAGAALLVIAAARPQVSLASSARPMASSAFMRSTSTSPERRSSVACSHGSFLAQ